MSAALVPSASDADITDVDALLHAASIVLDRAAHSPHTQRAYGRALRAFLRWLEERGFPPLSRALVYHYITHLEAETGAPPSSITQALVPIRGLARELALAGHLSEATAMGISLVRAPQQRGTRTGNWLTREQAQALLDAPDTTTLKGIRDRALLAVLLGAGLRREELASLRFEHIQQRDGRWAIVDLIGKRRKIRSVPIPPWTKAAVDAWAEAAGGIASGPVFRPLRRGGHLTDGSGDEAGLAMTPQSVHFVVSSYTARIGVTDIAPHDLRRTFAKLAHKGGAAVEQIQLSLGHDSVRTTELYLGVDQDFTDAPCDHVGLRLA